MTKSVRHGPLGQRDFLLRMLACSVILSLCLFFGCNRRSGGNDASADLPPGPVLEWANTFGGDKDDEARFMIPTGDGRILVSGWTTSKGNGGRDAWVFCLDESGKLLWEQTYGGKENDEAGFIAPRREGGFVVCGLTASQGNGESDAWVFVIDEQGNQQWERTCGGEQFDRADAIAQATDGGFLVSGGTRSQGAGKMDAWVLRFDKTGELISDNVLGGEAFDRLSFLSPTNDGGFVACGQTGSQGAGGLDFWVVRFDETGNQLWQKTYGNERDNWCECIIQTSDGGYIAAGETKPAGSHKWDAWIVRLDEEGERIWDNSFGGNGDEWFNTVSQTSDGGFIFCGVTESVGAGDGDVWVVRTDTRGKLLWHQPLGGKALDSGYAVCEIAAGRYCVSARTASSGRGGQDAWILRFNEPGSAPANR